jgi:regulator of nucleoside diphosphate kinase
MAPAIITAPDRQRLKKTIRDLRDIVGDPYHFYLDGLEKRIKNAVIVAHDEVPDDVVTMHSMVRLYDLFPHRRQAITLVYVDEADPVQNKVSVVTPLGTSLLGARLDDMIRWRSRFGDRIARIDSILFQPEAAERHQAMKEHEHDYAAKQNP